ncbi:twin-arginine translocation pathway signal [Phlyctema vagabunda]|uniref:Twin-arginine translocation pathway signal n=1 Tax=Phlyctema vagabunda TaxID=108571 RepID=A0ABR4PIT7_9HELO
MFFSSAIISALAVAGVSAAPSWNEKRQAAVTDADILQYALTLEHLEDAFYKKALSEMPESAFIDAGFTKEFYNQLKYVAHDEEGHVLYLEAGLKAAGATPVASCEYEFGFTDPKTFVATAAVIEGVGVSAYLGAAADITSKAYLTAAGSILVTEALHQSAQRNAIGEIPMANVFGTPLGLNAVYTIAAGFIVSCPSTNAALPVKAYPALTIDSGLPTATGANIEFSVESIPEGTAFATFVSGLDILPVPITLVDGKMMAAVPEMVEGQSYVFITSDNSGNVTDATVLAGPAIVEVTPSSPTFDLSI